MSMWYYPCSSGRDISEGSKQNIGPLGRILEGALKRIKKGKVSEEEILVIWKESAGEKACNHSRPRSLKKGSLVIDVDSSGWLYELTLRKKELLKAVGQRLKGKKLKEIRFRIGEIK